MTDPADESDTYTLVGALENARYWHHRAEALERERDEAQQEVVLFSKAYSAIERERDELRAALVGT